MLNKVFDSLRSLIGDVGDQVAKLQEQILAKEKALNVLRSAPISRDDFKAFMLGHVDRIASEFDGDLSFTVQRLSRDPLKPYENHEGIRVLHNGGVDNPDRTIERAVLSLLGHEIKRALSERIDRMNWPGDAGPVQEKRLGMIAKLEGELQELRAELDEVRRAAAAAGLLV